MVDGSSKSVRTGSCALRWGTQDGARKEACRVSLGLLEDLGYSVDFRAAEPYELPSGPGRGV